MAKANNVKLTPKQVQIIRLLADNGLKVKPVADAMFYNINTITYHISQVKKATRLDPRNFYDMVELLKLIAEEKN